MAVSTMKLTELPLRTTIPFASHQSSSSSLHFSFSSSSRASSSCLSKSPLHHILRPFSSLRPTTNNRPKPSNDDSNFGSSSPWLSKWGSSILPPIQASSKPTITKPDKRAETREPGRASAIDRIVLRLRNLGLGSDDEDEGEDYADEGSSPSSSALALNGQEKLGDLLKRDWVRQDTMLAEDETIFPWERKQEEEGEEGREGGFKRRAPKPHTLAELTLEDVELRRLRTVANTIRDKINVPKAGITMPVLQKIHEQWRKCEVARLKFHEVLARDMRTAHEIVERRTGGLVIWRSGSVMMVYRGVNYVGPSSTPKSVEIDGDGPVMDATHPITRNGDIAATTLHDRKPVLSSHVGGMVEEEAEFNSLLDGLGPRFDDWWGTGIIPVDADLLPQTVPGFKTPLRLLPTGMRISLSNAEMTNLRKLAKSLPCHFALGRNRNHQGLAASIIKLWEKSLVAKIAVKRGIQNTNNELMATELRNLTGGVLLLRNKYYIVIYRGKDFVPSTVAAALAERQEMAKQIQDAEEKSRGPAAEATPSGEEGQALAGTLAEFYEAQAQWGREISKEEHKKMIEAASKMKADRVVRRLERKLTIAQSRRLKADNELAKIRESWLPVGPPDDQETITDEERVMFRKVGLQMTPYLPLGIRGVFDGVIENMHLHWKHRELVKLISKQQDLAFVEETARLLEYESGGILIDIVRVPKGYAIIYYRGKNYRRPISIRPRNLPTKARALKRWKALQRYEALTQHVAELEKAREQMKVDNSEDEASWMNSDSDEDEDLDWDQASRNEDNDSLGEMADRFI